MLSTKFLDILEPNIPKLKVNTVIFSNKGDDVKPFRVVFDQDMCNLFALNSFNKFFDCCLIILVPQVLQSISVSKHKFNVKIRVPIQD
jgi:hypothetical protein